MYVNLAKAQESRIPVKKQMLFRVVANHSGLPCSCP